MQDARHPIHRVRIPYGEFPSPKTCRNIHKSSLKINMILKRANDARGPLIRMHARSSRNCMISQTCKRRKHALTFLVFPSVKVCMLHDIDAYLTI